MKSETNFLFSTNLVEVSSSSNMEEFPPENLLNPNKKLLWLSEENLPQYVIFDLSKMNIRPLIVRGVGIYLGSNQDTNPHLIEILISKKSRSFISLGNFELSLSPGIQILSTDEILFNDITHLKIVVKETFGGDRTYINKIYLYEHLTEQFQEGSIIDSREKSLPLISKLKKKDLIITSNELIDSQRPIHNNNDRIPFSNNNNMINNINNNQRVTYTRTSLTESDLSERNNNNNNNQPMRNNNNINNEDSGNKQHENSVVIPNENFNQNKNINIVIDDDFDDEDKKQGSNKKSELNKDNYDLNLDDNLDKFIPIITTDNLNTQTNNNNNHFITQNEQSTHNNKDDLAFDPNNLLFDYNNNKTSTNNDVHDYLVKFNQRLTSVENEVFSLKEKLSQMNSKLNSLVNIVNTNNNNYNYVIEECHQIIESKLSAFLNSNNMNSNNNITSDPNINNNYYRYTMSKDFQTQPNIKPPIYMSLNGSPSNKGMFSPNYHTEFTYSPQCMKNYQNYQTNEDILNQKLDEKLNQFTQQLQTKIYSSLLKPSLSKLELKLKENLEEVKTQINEAEQKKSEHYHHKSKGFSSHEHGNECYRSIKNRKGSSNHNKYNKLKEQSKKLEELTNKLQNKLDEENIFKQEINNLSISNNKQQQGSSNKKRNSQKHSNKPSNMFSERSKDLDNLSENSD